jgi:FtsP/CotA-like multicopper oxidase with cupredoxin domain
MGAVDGRPIVVHGFVDHCHAVAHQDLGMMRPVEVVS